MFRLAIPRNVQHCAARYSISSRMKLLGMRAMSTAHGLLDITKEIKIDHDNVRELFQRFKQSTSLEQKKAIANTLIREMSIHGDAEEVSVYNDYANLGLKGPVVHNKEEHAEIKKLVFKAEHMMTSNEKYDDVMTEAVDAFLAHAREEETEQFAALSPEDSDKIARAFLKSREKVPFRPHPLAPQSGGILQAAAGTHGKIQDKIVEKVQGREYVSLQHGHPQV